MRYLTILILLLGFTTAHAQVELLPDADRTPNVYMQANEFSGFAGYVSGAISAGAGVDTKINEGVFINARITPTLVDAFGIHVIGGLGASAGYLTDRQITKTNWQAIYGLRYKSVEVTRSHVYHYGEDYVIPFTIRWYMN